VLKLDRTVQVIGIDKKYLLSTKCILFILDFDIIVSKSDMLGPNAYLSNIENLVSFERAMFEDYSFKYRTKIFILFMSISPH